MKAKILKMYRQFRCKHDFKFIEEKRIRKPTIFGLNTFNQLTFVCGKHCGKVRKYNE